MQRMQAEIMASAIGEKVLETLDRQEQEIDDTIKRLEQADDDELERLREKRLEQMKARAHKQQELRAQGHGEYSLVTDTAEFFALMKKSDKIVVHFFTPANAFCQLIDGHLTRLAPRHLETRFVRLNAEKHEFLVERLGVWMIPCIALIKGQKVVKMVQGLDELGGTDKFSTAFLAYFCSLHEVLTFEGATPETATDDCGGLYASNSSAGAPPPPPQQQSAIRQTIYYDSDLEDEDDD